MTLIILGQINNQPVIFGNSENNRIKNCAFPKLIMKNTKLRLNVIVKLSLLIL